MLPFMERLTLIERLWRAVRTVGLILAVLAALVALAFVLSWFGVIPSPVQLTKEAIDTVRNTDWKMVLAVIVGVPFVFVILDDLLGINPRRGPDDQH